MNFITFKNNYLKKEVREFSNNVSSSPLVSVLVQTYQHKPYIKDCVNGILAQRTNFPFEIIIGEDESNDGTREVCIELAKATPDKIRLLLHHRDNQKKVLGEPTSNFNAFYNFYSANGKYLAICEGDDKWEDPLKLQKQIDYLILNQDCVLTYHPFKTINTHGEPVDSPEEFSQPKWDFSREFLSTGIYHPLLLTVCFKNVFEEIPEEMIEVINIDTFLLSLLGTHGKAKYIENIRPAQYRKHPGGIWSSRLREKQILSKIITYYHLSGYYFKINNMDLYSFYSKAYRNHSKMLLLKCLKKGRVKYIFSSPFRFLRKHIFSMKELKSLGR